MRTIFTLRHPRSRGFTLVELLIAMVLSMVVIGAVIAVFVANRQSYRATEGLSRVQENVRLAFEQMARDLREAGAVPCGARINSENGDADAPIFNVLTNNTGVWWEDWTRALAGYETGTAFPGATAGVPQAVDIGAGSDALQTLAGIGAGMAVTAHDSNTHLITMRAAGHGIANGDIALICNYVQGAIFQANNVAGNVIGHSAGGTPGNFQADLEWGSFGGVVTPKPYAFSTNAIVVPLQSSGWYVGCNNRADCGIDQGRSLYRTHLVNTGGVVAPQVDEIVDGVRGMNIEYLEMTPAGTLPAAYVNAAGVTSWNMVVSARITLTVSTLEQSLTTGNAVGNNTRLTRVLTHVVNLRNRVQ